MRFLCAPAKARRGPQMMPWNCRFREGRGACGRSLPATAAAKSLSSSKRGEVMARRPLGRGLDALIGSTSAERANGNDYARAEAADGGAPALMMLRVESITPGPFQQRGDFDVVRLKELGDAILSHGGS